MNHQTHPQGTDTPAEKKIKFLDVVENGYAGDSNPRRIGIYIRTGRRSGRMNPGKYYVLTDGKGNFWEMPADSEKLRITGNLLRQTEGTDMVSSDPENQPEALKSAPVVRPSEQTLDELVRDLTRSVPMPKSEVRRALLAYTEREADKAYQNGFNNREFMFKSLYKRMEKLEAALRQSLPGGE
jgi:hypothetical protein